VGLFEAEAEERRQAAVTYRQHGQDDAADELDREHQVILDYLETLTDP
jgi:uncharacterized protein YqeY